MWSKSHKHYNTYLLIAYVSTYVIHKVVGQPFTIFFLYSDLRYSTVNQQN